MRKLLLGTTALAAATAMSASALADVSIAGSYEFKYGSRSSQVAANDGTTMTHGDTDMVLTFTNKTDSGLTLSYRYDISPAIADGGNATIDENSLAISGGFGKIILGQDDDAGDTYNIDEMDLPTEEPTGTSASASIGTSSSIASTDAMKVAYHLPAMGGLTAGISFADSGTNSGTDTSSMGAKYAMDAGGASITLGYAMKKTEAATKDTDQTNMGVKVVSGDISMILSQGTYEAVDEDRDNQGASISYKMPNGMTVAGYTFKSEDALDVGEEYSRTGVEVAYTIASGLTAVVNIDDYDYKVTAANHESADTVVDNGTITQLTLKASF
ncbi:porin [Alphaproteobacteria bacterium]|nr:porin [Alphaproteobacteria bacterium]